MQFRHTFLNKILGMNNLAIVCFYVSVLKLTCFGADNPDPLLLWRGVQSIREQIPPSRLELKTTILDPLKQQQDYYDSVEFDGERRHFVSYNTTLGSTNISETLFNGAEAILYSDKQIAIRNLSSGGSELLFDPRTLGLVIQVWQIKLADCFPGPNSPKLENLGSEIIDGVPTWHVRSTLGDGSTLDDWIDDQHSFRLLRHEEKWICGFRRTTSTYNNSIYRWLPSHVVTEEYGDNGVQNRKWEIKILKAQENIKFNEGKWTISGLNPKINTRIFDYRSNSVVGYWDGKGIISEFDWNRRPAVGLKPIPTNNKRIVFIAILIVTAVSSLIILFRRFRIK
jgi:hypothetical protein